MTLTYRWSCIQKWLPPHDESCTAGGEGDSMAVVAKAAEKHTTKPPKHPAIAGAVAAPAVPEGA